MGVHGHRHTEATKKRMSEAKAKRPVVAISMEDLEIKFFESTRAAQDQGFASSNVTAACKRRIRHCYGFYWRYADEFENVDKVLGEVAADPPQTVRAVVSVDPFTKQVRHYSSIRSTEDDGHSYYSVVAALTGATRRASGLYWRYVEDFESADQVLEEEAAYDSIPK